MKKTLSQNSRVRLPLSLQGTTCTMLSKQSFFNFQLSLFLLCELQLLYNCSDMHQREFTAFTVKLNNLRGLMCYSSTVHNTYVGNNLTKRTKMKYMFKNVPSKLLTSTGFSRKIFFFSVFLVGDSLVKKSTVRIKSGSIK